MGGTIRSKNGHLIQIGGIEDHVHLLVNLPVSTAVSDSIRDLKANSSRWVNDNSHTTVPFQWQKGYGAFTVSYSQVDVVRRCIQDQRAHHHKKTFREEYIELLKRHGIAFEPEYLFEGEHVG